MSDFLSQDVKEVIGLSLKMAIRTGNDFIGTGHLVLSLISNSDDSIVKIFNKLNIDTPELIALLELSLKNNPSENILPTKGLPLTRMAEKAIRVSVLEARSCKGSSVEPKHLMLAILKDQSTMATLILNSFDVDYDLFAAALLG